MTSQTISPTARILDASVKVYFGATLEKNVGRADDTWKFTAIFDNNEPRPEDGNHDKGTDEYRVNGSDIRGRVYFDRNANGHWNGHLYVKRSDGRALTQAMTSKLYVNTREYLESDDGIAQFESFKSKAQLDHLSNEIALRGEKVAALQRQTTELRAMWDTIQLGSA